jgi:agmatinase
MAHGYESGRLNLPFVGISTFGKRPYIEDWTRIDADAAILGAPFDAGTQFRAGARFGPRAVREASTLFSFGHAGAYDHEDDRTYLGADVRIVDIGDADIVHTDTERSHANIETGVRAILGAGALPVVIGGDHSINIPCIRAFEGTGPVPHPPDRRASGFRGRTARGPERPRQSDAPCGRTGGSHRPDPGGHPQRLLDRAGRLRGRARHGRRHPVGPAGAGAGGLGVAARIPKGARVYVTLDIDGFCPSIAPGTGTPSHGGFLYYEVLELLQSVARSHEVVGIDLVEVAPDYDHSGTTAILAAQVLLNFLGRVMHARAEGGAVHKPIVRATSPGRARPSPREGAWHRCKRHSRWRGLAGINRHSPGGSRRPPRAGRVPLHRDPMERPRSTSGPPCAARPSRRAQ